MYKIGKIGNIIAGIFLLLLGLYIALVIHGSGYRIVVILIALSFFFSGIKNIGFYFSMARCMVGGEKILVRGVIFLDLSLFAVSLTTVPKMYIVVYLVITLLFEGIVHFLRAMEAKRNFAPRWQLTLAAAVIYLDLGIAAFFTLRYTDVAVIIYGATLCYSAIVRIMHSFQKTEIVYIQ